MKDTKLRNLLLGSILVGGLAAGVSHCSSKNQDKDEDNKDKTEVQSSTAQKDPYGNVELFERSRSDIKFALAFVENYYPYIYWCGKKHGTCSLYGGDDQLSKIFVCF